MDLPAGPPQRRRPPPPVLRDAHEGRDRDATDALQRAQRLLVRGRLLVPDAKASAPRVHVFDASGAGAPTETAAFVPDSANGLPPREIAWY